MDEQILRVATSEALNLRLEIDAGGNAPLLKLQFCQKLRDHDGGREVVDLMLAFESTFGTKALEKTVNTFYGGNFANVNLGNQFGAVNAAINGIPLDQPKSAEIMDALRKLMDGVNESAELNDGQKQEALESIETIAEQAGSVQGGDWAPPNCTFFKRGDNQDLGIRSSHDSRLLRLKVQTDTLPSNRQKKISTPRSNTGLGRPCRQATLQAHIRDHPEV